MKSNYSKKMFLFVPMAGEFSLLLEVVFVSDLKKTFVKSAQEADEHLKGRVALQKAEL